VGAEGVKEYGYNYLGIPYERPEDASSTNDSRTSTSADKKLPEVNPKATETKSPPKAASSVNKLSV
jgi:hypothetical protein